VRRYEESWVGARTGPAPSGLDEEILSASDCAAVGREDESGRTRYESSCCTIDCRLSLVTWIGVTTSVRSKDRKINNAYHGRQ
jgi:hypothetical protein